MQLEAPDVLPKVPAEQAWHAPIEIWPGRKLKKPGWQETHTVALVWLGAAEYEPAGQKVHELKPDDKLKVPAGHCWHAA
jgi:hypothetical protein